MKQDQQSLTSMLKEHSARKRFAVAVFLIAIVTTVAVFWALRISGLTLEDGGSGSATSTDTTADENATGTDAGISTLSLDEDYRISVASDEGESEEDEEGDTSTDTSSSGDTWYYADTTALDTAAANQDDSYIIYTKIGDTYYVVSAKNTLVECTNLDDDSITPESDRFETATAGVGYYCWTETDEDGNEYMAFKYTASSSDDDFANYRWTLSGTDAGSDTFGTGTYTLYNSAQAVYIAPQDVGVSETLSGTSWWGNTEDEYYEKGKDYSLSADSMLIYTLDYTEVTVDSIAVSGAFMVEIYDGTNNFYIDTSSAYDCWFTPNSVDENDGKTGNDYRRSYNGAVISITSGDGAISLKTGNKYIVMVERSTVTADDDSKTDTYVITYYDSGYNVLLKYTATGVTHTDNAVVARIYAQQGTYEVSAVYAVSKSVADTENDTDVSKNSLTLQGVTYSITSLTDDSSITDDEENVTYYKTGELVGDASLAGDFDVTYSFTNYGSNYSGHHDQNYVLAIYNSDGTEWIYMQPNYTTSTYASGAYTWVPKMEGNNASNAIVSSYVNGVSTYEPDSTTWRSWMNQASGTTCSVNIVRQKNVITVTTTLYRNNSAFYSYVTTIIDSAFDDAAVQIYLTAVNANITGLTITDNSTAYDVTGYDSYSAVGTYYTSLRLAGTEAGSISLVTATSKFLDSVTLSADSTSSMSFAKSAGTNTVLYLAKVNDYFVWFDATNGGMASYSSGSSDDAYDELMLIPYDASGNLQSITTPSATDVTDASGYGTTSASYTLRGWYDIYNEKYYEPDSEVSLSGSTVMYADWEVTSYDIGQDAVTVDSISTNNFITTKLFDYNELFNLQSEELVDSVSRTATIENIKYSMTEYRTLTLSGHRELFTLSSSSSIAMGDSASLGFLFFRSESYPFYYSEAGSTSGDNNPLVDYPDGRGDIAINKSSVNGSSDEATQGILGAYGTLASSTTAAASTFSTPTTTLLSALFGTDNTVKDVDDPTTESFILGKTYVGTADYLFQYDSDSGYYYYNSEKNAASYNATAKRFYVYDYLVYARGTGSSDDFFPFNYVAAEKDTSTDINTNNINYWFGMSTEIEFYLPSAVPAADADNSGKVNLASDNDHHMTFKFSGDDDVWVFIDGKLVLDLGGVHGQVYGEIDFSTGEVVVVNTMETTTTDSEGNSVTVKYVDYDTRGIIDYTTAATEAKVVIEQEDAETYVRQLSAGTHTLTFYYLERGASQSNAAIYFNISSTSYNLNLSKVDADNAETTLNGAEFTFYTDSTFSTEAELLKEQNGTEAYSTFSSSDTVYGLLEGVTYYVVETTAPDGYSAEGKYFTVLLSGSVLTITVYETGSTEAVELYTYTITYADDGTCTYELTYADDATTQTASESWYYVLGSKATFSASVSSSGAVQYYTIGLTIANAVGYELPATGGTGIQAYVFTGEALVLFAGVGIITIAFYRFVWVREICTDENNKEYTKEKTRSRGRFARTRDHPRERIVNHGHARDRPGGRLGGR